MCGFIDFDLQPKPNVVFTKLLDIVATPHKLILHFQAGKQI